MLTVITRYYPISDTNPARIKAFAPKNPAKFYYLDYESTGYHQDAADDYATRTFTADGRPVECKGRGALPNGDSVHLYDYVTTRKGLFASLMGGSK